MKIRRSRGRPRYVPTPADRNTVTSMAACGFKHEDIARCLGTEGIDDKTLRKHFRAELDTAAEKANAAVANKAYQLAVAGNPYQMTMFWLKCRAGWRDVVTTEFTGANGNPLFDSYLTKMRKRLEIAMAAVPPEQRAKIARELIDGDAE